MRSDVTSSERVVAMSTVALDRAGDATDGAYVRRERHSLVRALGAAQRVGRREMPANAVCSACAECDARVLRWVKLGSERVVLCANDAARVRAAAVRAESLAEGMLLLLDVLGG